MSDNIKMEDLIEAPTSEAKETTEVVDEQDPLKLELEKVQRKEGRTEAEKAAFSLKKNAERALELGIDPAEVLGLKTNEEDTELDDDDKPITVGMFKQLQQQAATKTALQLVDDIPNETERELVKYHIENTIRSTGNPTEDVSIARAIVNAAKNKQILEEVSRKTPAKTHSSASSAPARFEEQIELTQAEIEFMKPPFNLTKEQIIAARPKK